MGGGQGPGIFRGTVGSGERERLLDRAKNAKLRNAINQMYRPGATGGDGGLADAIRHESETGELVGGRSHTRKGQERLTNLKNILAKQHLSASDKALIRKLIADLESALRKATK